jgi:hypothetical protein
LTARLGLAVLAVLVGAVWIGQGLGYIPGSFMTDDPFWALMGVLLAGGGIVVMGRALRDRRAPRP